MSVILRSAQNQNEYTKGYFNGREFEQKRIAALLNDAGVDQMVIDEVLEGNPGNIRCLSAEAVELMKSDAHYFGRRKAIGDAVAFLEKWAAEWKRTPTLSVRRLVLDLAAGIRGLD